MLLLLGIPPKLMLTFDEYNCNSDSDDAKCRVRRREVKRQKQNPHYGKYKAILQIAQNKGW